jgi:hypothetical protein
MKIALLDVKVGTKVGCTFTAVNMRNMILLSKELNADFYYSVDQLKGNNKLYDVVLVGFGSVSSEAVVTRDFISNNCKRAIFISGEYEQQTSPALWYSNKNYDVVKNYEGIGNLAGRRNGRILKTYELNLNLLIAKEPNQVTQKKYDCIYYGRWREDRAKYFKRYIQNGMYLSTSTKNMKKFKHAGCNPKYLYTISWEERKETLNLFRYSLYIEDEYTHNVFNNLANRWYEAGFCNNVVFFDVNCWNTIRKSEIAYFEEQIKDYIVSSDEDLQAKIEYCNQDFERHLAIQKGWRLNQMVLRQDMINQLKRIIENSVKTA